MTICAELREDLRLVVVIQAGALGQADLDQLIGIYGNESAAGCDHVVIFAPDADVSTISAAMLDDFKARLVAAIAHHQHNVIIRAALICQSPACQDLALNWVANSRPDDGLYRETKLLPDLASATEWLQLTAKEAEGLDACVRALLARASARPRAA